MDIVIPVTIKEGGERGGPFNDLIGAIVKNAEVTRHVGEDLAKTLRELLRPEAKVDE